MWREGRTTIKEEAEVCYKMHNYFMSFYSWDIWCYKAFANMSYFAITPTRMKYKHITHNKTHNNDALDICFAMDLCFSCTCGTTQFYFYSIIFIFPSFLTCTYPYHLQFSWAVNTDNFLAQFAIFVILLYLGI